jgi:hypothetical protein
MGISISDGYVVVANGMLNYQTIDKGKNAFPLCCRCTEKSVNRDNESIVVQSQESYDILFGVLLQTSEGDADVQFVVARDATQSSTRFFD